MALKTLSSETSDAAALRGFEKEFLLLAQLKHPGVVEVLDFGYSEDAALPGRVTPYFTMEYVEGRSLEEVLASLRLPQPSPAELVEMNRLIWQMCDILEFLHLRGIVHCDLKPDNIKITERAYGPKILDFGLFEEIGSRTGFETKGTLPYMAPEMFRQEPLDERTDLYSLGILLYQVITGRLPFASDDPVKIVSGHLQTKPVPPSRLNPHLPPYVDQLILRLLEKRSADRPASAMQVKQIVEAWPSSESPATHTGSFSVENTLLAHLSSGPLVGRESEIARMKRDMEEATGCQGKNVLVSGEPGVGKTSLLRQLRRECQLRGMVFIDSNCLENQTLAYQPLMEILRKLEPYLENRCPESLVDDFRKLLHWSETDFSSQGDQASLHRRMAKLLISASRSFPFVMAIQNLQWVDLLSLQFLEHLQDKIAQGRIFLCCTLCPEEMQRSDSAADSIRHLLVKGNITHLKLQRLDASGTRALIASKFIRNRFDPQFFSWVHRRTSGNPFFVVESLKCLLEEGYIFHQHSVWTADFKGLEQSQVPATVEAVLQKNLERYDQGTVNLLEVLAVVGKKSSLRLLNQLELFDEGTLVEKLSALTQDQLLIRREEAGEKEIWYEFANQSLQSLLYQRFDERKRIDWHKKIAASLEAEISSEEHEAVFDLAHHYLEGRVPEKAYHYALQCAQRMQQRFANDEALGYLENAIQVSSLLPDPQEALSKKAEALMKRAGFCVKVGELNRAEEDYLAVLQLAGDRRDLKMLVSAYNGLGEVCRLKRDHQRGIAYLKQAMIIHRELNDPFELAHTLTFMGLLYWIDSEYARALDSFHRALNIDRKLGNKFYEANTLNNMGLVYWSRRQYSHALKHFTDALAVYRDLDNKEWLARTQNNIGATLFEMGNFQECIDHFLESYRINDETKNEKEMAFNLENLSEAYRKMGDHSAAVNYGLRGLKLATEIDFTDRVGRILRGLGMTYLELGQYQQAHHYLKKARRVAENVRDRELQVLVLLDTSKLALILNDRKAASGWLDKARKLIDSIGDEKSLIAFYQMKSDLEKGEGRSARALELLNDALALAQKLNVGEELFSLSLDLAELHLDGGDLDKSKELLDRLIRSGPERYTSLVPEFHLVRGRVYWSDGDAPSARKALETGIIKAEGIKSKELLWRIHHQLGKLLLSLRDAEGAYRELKSAATILRELSQGIGDDGLKQGYLRESGKNELLSHLKVVAKELIGETKSA